MDYRNTKIRILSREHSKAFQEAVFAAGGKWHGIAKMLAWLDVPYIYVSESLAMYCSSNQAFFDDSAEKEITFPMPTESIGWNGAGVPPVGCEVVIECNCIGLDYLSGIVAEVISTGKDNMGSDVVTVKAGHHGYRAFMVGAFRPLQPKPTKTERELFVDEAMDNVPVSRTTATELYDKGYRKVSESKESE
tara:strand:+ start:213 stop:785 length:573 start_codon:yes stop_codon:yes gene_type:complete